WAGGRRRIRRRSPGRVSGRSGCSNSARPVQQQSQGDRGGQGGAEAEHVHGRDGTREGRRFEYRAWVGGLDCNGLGEEVAEGPVAVAAALLRADRVQGVADPEIGVAVLRDDLFAAVQALLPFRGGGETVTPWCCSRTKLLTGRRVFKD